MTFRQFYVQRLQIKEAARDLDGKLPAKDPRPISHHCIITINQLIIWSYFTGNPLIFISRSDALRPRLLPLDLGNKQLRTPYLGQNLEE